MKTKRLFSALFLSCLLPVAALADVWQDPETKVNYEYTVGKKEASVKSGSSSAGSPEVTGDIAILSKFSVDGNEYTVVSIDYLAFKGCTGLTNVTIPSSVTSIGGYTFSGCTGLTSVTIPEGVTSIGYFAFYDCKRLTSVTIPSSVDSIGGSAFLNCSHLKEVHFSDVAAWCNIKFVNHWANPLRYAYHLFSNGTEITNLVIPSGVTSIGNYAFIDCTGLTSVTIPSNVTSIGINVFIGCINLKEVHISDVAAWCNIRFDGVDSNPLYYAHHLF